MATGVARTRAPSTRHPDGEEKLHVGAGSSSDSDNDERPAAPLGPACSSSRSRGGQTLLLRLQGQGVPPLRTRAADPRTTSSDRGGRPADRCIPVGGATAVWILFELLGYHRK